MVREMNVGSRPRIRLGFKVRALHFDEIKKQHTLINANHKSPWDVWETEACQQPVQSEAGRRIKDNLNTYRYAIRGKDRRETDNNNQHGFLHRYEQPHLSTEQGTDGADYQLIWEYTIQLVRELFGRRSQGYPWSS